MRKLGIVIGLVVVLFITIVLGIWGSAYVHNRNVETNITRIKTGMSSEEVIPIMGEPVKKHMTDGPGEIWCYTIYPLDDYDENCGVAVDISGMGRVTSIQK